MGKGHSLGPRVMHCFLMYTLGGTGRVGPGGQGVGQGKGVTSTVDLVAAVSVASTAQ